MNTKQQGAIGVAKAISYFTEEGYIVSVPISDVQRYDLIADDSKQLIRVEVKTSFYKRTSYEVVLKTAGGNQSGKGKTKPISSEDCDVVFIYVEDGSRYVVPVEILDGKSSVRLTPKLDCYKV